ncbi:MAG: hypothetical protein HY696_09380 [Deltaproteobacteria bacterium]|nr:hypothetical protein [Deltaproteobacteria bacterium]
MSIRPLTTFADFDDCQRVQRQVWSFDESEVVPTHLFAALVGPHGHGGLLFGRRLLLAAAEQASAAGHTTLEWTYDPLESVNAYLYLHKLGAVATAYFDGYYPIKTAGLRANLPQDRLKVVSECHATVSRERAPSTSVVPTRTITIPGDVQSLKQSDSALALQLRLTTRAQFHHHLTRDGCRAADYT